MKKNFFLAPLVVMLLTACGGSSQEDLNDSIEFFPAKEESNGKWGLLGKDGQMLISEEFKNEPSPVVNGLFFVKDANGTYTVFKASKKPEEVMENLVEVGYLIDGLMPIVRKNERINIVNKSGNTEFVLEPVNGKEIVQCLSMFTDGLLIARDQDGNFGAYNTKGKVVVDFKYNSIWPFSDGVALARKETGEGDYKVIVIDQNGKEIDDIKIKDNYSLQNNGFNNGYLLVRDSEGTYRFINKKGTEIKLPGKVEGVGEYDTKYFVFRGDDGWGVMTLSESPEVVIKGKYSGIEILGGDQFLVKDDKDTYILNKKGEKIEELSDEYASYIHIKNAKFKFIAREKSHYVLLDAHSKPINKDEYYSIETSLSPGIIGSLFFDTTGMVQSLLQNISGNGVASYSIGEPASSLGLDADNYRYSRNFNNEEINYEGYKYSINFSGHTDEYITVSEYNFDKGEYLNTINPESKVDRLTVTANFNKDCWDEAKQKVYDGLKAKGFKTEVEGESSGVFSNGNIIALVEGGAYSITVQLIEKHPTALEFYINQAKDGRSSFNEYVEIAKEQAAIEEAVIEEAVAAW